jgi:hypothetical protein
MKAESSFERNLIQPRRHGGSSALATAVVAILLLLIYWRTAESMIEIWFSLGHLRARLPRLSKLGLARLAWA